MKIKYAVLFLALVMLLSACSGMDELSDSAQEILELARTRASLTEQGREEYEAMTEDIIDRLRDIEQQYFALSERQKTFLTDRIGGEGNLQLIALWDEYYAYTKESAAQS